MPANRSFGSNNTMSCLAVPSYWCRSLHLANDGVHMMDSVSLPGLPACAVLCATHDSCDLLPVVLGVASPDTPAPRPHFRP